METVERLFFGLHLDPLFQGEIATHAKSLRVLYPNQKWVNLRHFHFTIHFLGDTNPDQKIRVIQIAKEVAAETKPFSIILKGMGAFPSLMKPRVIWIGAAEECLSALNDLYSRLTKPLIKEGFLVEHESFTPHATLFRVRADDPIEWNPDIFDFPQSEGRIINKLSLFRSTQTEWGSEYVPVDSYPFIKRKGII